MRVSRRREEKSLIGVSGGEKQREKNGERMRG